MPRAHYKNVHQGIEKQNVAFRPPKNIQSPESWVTAIRKSIPEVPDVRRTDWCVQVFDPSTAIILIELVNSVGERCRIAVDRKADALAA